MPGDASSPRLLCQSSTRWAKMMDQAAELQPGQVVETKAKLRLQKQVMGALGGWETVGRRPGRASE